MDSTKRKNSNKRNLTISSDSEDDIKTSEPDVKTRRQSSRIHDKQHKPEFKLPSRDEVWKDIPTLTSIPKIKNITPRKSVNNFTKVYNDYNYDDYEDTSDDDSSSVESSDHESQTKRQHRIKNYHKRLQVPSSSSDDDSKLDKCDKDCVENSTVMPEKHSKKSTTEVADEQGCERNCDDMKKFDLDQTIPIENNDLGDSDESDVVSPCKRNAHLKNRSVLESDDDSTQNDNDDGGSHTDTSHSSDSTDLPVESSRQRSANVHEKTVNMFKEFRDAQTKRKKSVSST